MRYTFLLYTDLSAMPPMTDADMEQAKQVYGT
jgi:hypothetical protein